MSELLTVGVAALTIFALIVAGVAVMFYGNVKALRETTNDLRGRVGDLESERDSLKSKLNEETVKHEGTRRDLAAVARVVTGEAHWVALEQQLTTHHDETVVRLDRIVDALEEGA